MIAAGKYREELEANLQDNLGGIRDTAKSEHELKFYLLSKVRLYVFWIALHLLIVALGVTLLIIALSK